MSASSAVPADAGAGEGDATAIRIEHDLLGYREVPAEAYYGIHTVRALENFPVRGGVPVGRHGALVRALAAFKEAAAAANAAEVIDASVAGAITPACRQVRAGALHEQMVVDVMQGGAGTSTNMNMNEVLANRALELDRLTSEAGDPYCHGCGRTRAVQTNVTGRADCTALTPHRTALMSAGGKFAAPPLPSAGAEESQGVGPQEGTRFDLLVQVNSHVVLVGDTGIESV